MRNWTKEKKNTSCLTLAERRALIGPLGHSYFLTLCTFQHGRNVQLHPVCLSAVAPEWVTGHIRSMLTTNDRTRHGEQLANVSLWHLGVWSWGLRYFLSGCLGMEPWAWQSHLVSRPSYISHIYMCYYSTIWLNEGDLNYYTKLFLGHDSSSGVDGFDVYFMWDTSHCISSPVNAFLFQKNMIQLQRKHVYLW